MAVVAHLARHFAPVVDFVYPPRCPACGGSIVTQDALCAECWNTLVAPVHDHVAGMNDAVPIYAASCYDDTSRRLVLAFKHGGRIALARLMARMIAARLPDPHGGPPLLVPVPLHRWRLWRRGYNQAALLAVELERLGKGEAAVDALVRRRATPSLGGLDRAARERALAGVITLAPGAADRVRQRGVIVVDDVLTSGATSRACLAAIAAADPASMAVACFARVDHAIGIVD